MDSESCLVGEILEFALPGTRADSLSAMASFQQVYFHKLGTPPSSDTYAVGKELPRIAEITLATSDDGKYTLAQVAKGDGGEFEHGLFDGKAWKQLTHPEVPIPPISSVGQIARLGGDEVLIRVSSYLQPSARHRFAGKGAVTSEGAWRPRFTSRRSTQRSPR